MKKFLVLILAVILLSACSKNDIGDIAKKFNDDVTNAKSYEINGKMAIYSDEEEFNYTLNVKYLKDNYYKVDLVNNNNDHNQIILRNKEGVYVITPALNKSYKFESSWPDNSSQSYLLNSLLKDINNDNKASLSKEGKNYVITCSVNYPSNDELTKEKIYFDKDMNLKKVVVFNKNNEKRIETTFNKIDYKTKLNENDFKLDEYIKKIENNTNCEGENCSKTTSNILDDIIYPLYLPGNTFLTSSESVGGEENKRVILTFQGDKDFTIIEETASQSNEFEIKPVYGDPIILNDTIGVMEDNSVRWIRGNVSYYLTSNDLSSSEMATIAVSMNHTKSVAESK